MNDRPLLGSYLDGVVGGIAVGLSLAMILYVIAHLIWSAVR
ncbi:MAG: hypothetical protein NUW01_00480 [Gemmatimonadaceae bacterium]|nr:hypothetical protein [Gemmatimonadaceae bacterium]